MSEIGKYEVPGFVAGVRERLPAALGGLGFRDLVRQFLLILCLNRRMELN
jgi:hypothetical protein